MREMRAECLMMRLSFFEVPNNPSLLRSLGSFWVRMELDLRARVLVKGRLPVTGAYLR